MKYIATKELTSHQPLKASLIDFGRFNVRYCSNHTIHHKSLVKS